MGAAEEISTILHQTPQRPRQGPGASLAVSATIALDLRQVSHRYAHGDPPALQDLNLEIKAGEWLAIVGASGAGKTTLLNLLLGFLPLQQGAIEVNGQPLAGLIKKIGTDGLPGCRNTPPCFTARWRRTYPMGDPLPDP
jgi:ATP-binding cassette, subfamily C, bacterial CydD